MSFKQRFQSALESLIPANNTRPEFLVAYSGGLDSHVLLHCCVQSDLNVRAVHVHHGLQSEADEWVVHCEMVCRAYGVELDVIYVNATKKQGESPEETARNERYRVLAETLQHDELLLMAQHRDDQAETLLLQLARGAGSAGLAAMPAVCKFASGIQLRPMLEFSQQEIRDYACQQQLKWIDDPSNLDTRFERNFIRHELMPVLQARWTDISNSLYYVSKQQGDNLQVLNDMAAIDLSSAVQPVTSAGYSLYENISALSINYLIRLSRARRFNLLRFWLSTSTGEPKSVSRNLLEEIERTMIYAESDAQPKIFVNDYEIRCFQQLLFCLKLRLPDECLDTLNTEISWDHSKPLFIGELAVTVALTEVGASAASTEAKQLLNLDRLNKELQVCFRHGGEEIKPAGDKHTRKLKKLLQGDSIPPWERETMPLFFSEGELVAVADRWVAEHFSVEANSSMRGGRISIHSI